jgi:hypothetical protein
MVLTHSVLAREVTDAGKMRQYNSLPGSPLADNSLMLHMDDCNALLRLKKA